MLKNKKKLRRIERNTPGYAVKTAQSLVLAGALVLGGAGMASAVDVTIDTTRPITTAEANALTATDKLIVIGSDVADVVATFTDAAVNTAGGLTITGASHAAQVTVDFNATFQGAVNVSGAALKSGTLQITADKTFTSSNVAGTTIGNFGVLSLVGDNTNAATSVAALVGNVTLAGNGAVLNATNGHANHNNAITGNVSILAAGGTLNVGAADGGAIANSYLTVTGDVSVADNAAAIVQVGMDGNSVANNGGNGTMTVTGNLVAGAGSVLNVGGAGGNAAAAVTGTNGGVGTLTVTEMSTTTGPRTIGGAGGNASATAAGGAGGDGLETVNGVFTHTGALTLGGSAGTSNTTFAGGNGGNGTLTLKSTGVNNITGNVQLGGAGSTKSTEVVSGTGGNGTLTLEAGRTNIMGDLALGGATGANNGGAGGTGAITVGSAGNSATLAVTGNTVINKGTLNLGANAKSGTFIGGITLNGADAKIATVGSSVNNVIQGNVIVTQGTIDTDTGGAALTIKNADGTDLGNLTMGAGSAWDLDAAAALTVGQLTLNKDQSVAGALNVQSLAGDKKLTLNNGGTLGFQDSTGKVLDATLQKTATSGLELGTGGTLTAKDLTLTGFDTAANGVGVTTNTTTLNAHTLNSATAIFVGSSAAHGAVNVNIAGGPLASASFLNQNMTIINNAANTTTVTLDSTPGVGHTGGSTDKKITLAGDALGETLLNVSNGNWSVGGLVLTKGTTTVANGASLEVTGGAGSLTGVATDGVLTVATGGAFTAQFDDLLKANFDKNAVFATNVSGIVFAKGFTGNYTIANLGMAYNNLKGTGNNGAVAFIDGTLTGDTTIDGATSVATPKASLKISAATTGANTTIMAKDLTITAASDTLTTGATSTLTLLGSGGTGNVLTGNTSVVGNVAMGNGAVVNLGSLAAKAAGITAQGGTVGNIAYSATTGGTVNVEAGTFASGKITGNAAADVLNVRGGTLNAKGVDFTTTAGGADAINVTQGVLNSTGAIATATTDGVTLDSGVMKTTGAFDINVGTLTITNGGIVQSGKDLTINTLDDGTTNGKVSNTTFIADGAMTVSTNGVNGDNIKVSVEKGLLTIGGDQNLTTTNSVIRAKSLTLTVGGNLDLTNTALAVTDTLTLGATTTSKIDGGSQAVVEKLVMTGGALTVGNADATKSKNSVLQVTNTTLGGATLSVLNAKASLGTLADNTTGTIFVDPAYVNIASTGAAFGGSLLAGKEGLITVGNLNEAWVQKAIMESGAAADSSVLGIQKSIALGAAGSIVVDKDVKSTGVIGTAAAAPMQKVYFGNKSLLAIDGSQFTDGTKPAAIAITTGGGTFLTSNTAGEAARLHITKVKTGDTVHVVSGLTASAVVIADATKGWQNNNITFDTQLFFGEGATNATGTVYNVGVNTHGATTIFPKLSNSMGNVVDNVMAQYGLQPESDNAGVRFVSRVVSNNYGLGGNNAEKAAATIEGAAQMAAVAGVQVSTIGAASVASGAVTTRTSFAQPLMDMTKAVAVHQDNDGALSLDTGLNAGNGMKNGLGVWIMPLYQSNKTWGQKAENFKSGMNSDLGGIALGADYTINDMFRFGAAFNVGAGYGQSTGDFNKTENRFNFWGVNLYGGWTMNNYGLSADVGYTSTFNAVKQDTPASLQMGNLKSDVTSSALQAGLKAEYKLETSVVDIIPHVGVRYMGLATDGYDVKSHGTVFSVERDFQSIWTFPIGVAFSKTITSDSGWMFKPMVDLSVVPAAGDIKAKSKTSIPGVGGQAEMKMQVVDTVTFDGGLGFEVGKDNLSFGLNYNVQASEHRTGHGVFGTLRYEF